MVDIDEIFYQKLFILILSFTFVSTDSDFFPSRTERDTYDEREKLLSTYKIISKTQCLLQMRSFDGYVHAQPITNLDDTKETNDGIFVFLPIAVNLFLIQHKESERYLCGRHDRLFGRFERNEQECLFETKRSEIDFGQWDSYRLLYGGYLSISSKCQTRLRRKYLNTHYLHFLALIRINTDVIVTYQNQSKIQSTKLMKDYRQRWMKSLKNVRPRRTRYS